MEYTFFIDNFELKIQKNIFDKRFYCKIQFLNRLKDD